MGPNHPISSISSSVFTYASYYGHSNFVAYVEDTNSDFKPGGPGPTFHPPAIIENDVWIGQDVLLARGIRIGTGSVIAAGSVVTKDIPPYSIVGGAPAKIIKRRFSDETCQKLLDSKWWEFAFTDLPKMKNDKIDDFISEILSIEPGRRFIPEKFSLSTLVQNEC